MNEQILTLGMLSVRFSNNEAILLKIIFHLRELMTWTKITGIWESKYPFGNEVMIDENTFWFIPSLSAVGSPLFIKPGSYLARNIPVAGDRKKSKKLCSRNLDPSGRDREMIINDDGFRYGKVTGNGGGLC